MRNEKTEKRLLSSFLLSLTLYSLGWALGLFEGKVFGQIVLTNAIEVHLQNNVSAWHYINHNLIVGCILVLSAGLPFLGPGCVLLTNGFLEGATAVPIAMKYGLPFLLAGLLPHGIAEMLAWIIACTIGLLLSQKVYTLFIQTFISSSTNEGQPQQAKDSLRSFLKSRFLRQLLYLGCIGVFLILIAGYLEAYVSPVLAQHFLK